MEAISQSFNGQSQIASTGTNQASATISRNGDLIHKMYVTVDSGTDNITDGSQIIQEAELEIGGQKIDKHYVEWNNVWNELSTPASKADGLKCMQGCVSSSNVTIAGLGLIQVPLNFWFCRNPGLALPLIALQYHEVKVQLTLGGNTATGLTGGTAVKLFVDYIYLDTDERRRFAQVSHEYLIEQVQRQAIQTGQSQKLVFNHPVKELIWTTNGTGYGTAQLKLNGHDRFSKQEEEYFQLRQPFDYHTAVPGQNIKETGIPTIPAEPVSKAVTASETISGGLLPMVGHEFLIGDMVLVAHNDTTGDGTLGHKNRIVEVTDIVANTSITISDTSTFEGVVVAADSTPGAGEQLYVSLVSRKKNPVCRTSRLDKKINVYSFALKPEEHQPSGTCNFSRIDTAILETGTGLSSNEGFIYAVNYNVLRIMSGMGGLAYSN